MPACKLRILPPRESERGVLILLEGFRNEFCVYKYPSPLSSPCADLAEMESRLMMTTETFILQGQPTFFCFPSPLFFAAVERNMETRAMDGSFFNGTWIYCTRDVFSLTQKLCSTDLLLPSSAASGAASRRSEMNREFACCCFRSARVYNFKATLVYVVVWPTELRLSFEQSNRNFAQIHSFIARSFFSVSFQPRSCINDKSVFFFFFSLSSTRVRSVSR